ncbi:Rha family transcriptional regulator [Arsenophonus sp. PmNCSU2021_1]|uniref:Rha family transcriptional regulator n=1 Tax=Arsenophonus sp. PmNCSU2021_1 TaxID=3118989 RepID=UPI002FF105D1
MTLQLSTITPKVTVHNGKTITTSQDVADYFGKLHKDVLRKIESLEYSIEFTSANFYAHVQKIDIGNGATRESKTRVSHQ